MGNTNSGKHTVITIDGNLVTYRTKTVAKEFRIGGTYEPVDKETTRTKSVKVLAANDKDGGWVIFKVNSGPKAVRGGPINGTEMFRFVSEYNVPVIEKSYPIPLAPGVDPVELVRAIKANADALMETLDRMLEEHRR